MLKLGDRLTAIALLANKEMIFEGGGVEKSADVYAKHHMLVDMKYLAEINTGVLDHQINVVGNTIHSMLRSK